MLARICGGVADGLRQLVPPGATGPQAGNPQPQAQAQARPQLQPQLQPFLAEFKYDGQRAQIHLLPGGKASACMGWGGVSHPCAATRITAACTVMCV